MDRSRRPAASGARPTTVPPAASRLTVRRKNRRRPGSTWSRLPGPAAIADACGRAARRSLRPLAVVGAIGALAGALTAGHHWITHSPRFAIIDIAITGAHGLDADQLRARLPIHTGDNAFVDLSEVTRAVRAEPWVASADVHRVLPHTIAIELREHTAVAALQLGEPGDVYLADATGRPFKRADLERNETAGLPLITGLDRAAAAADPDATARTVIDAVAAATAWRATTGDTTARPAVDEIHIDPHGGVTLHTADPAIDIQLGAVTASTDTAALTRRIHAFDTAWAGLTAAERARTRAIHLGARPDHVTVAFAKAEKE